MDDPLRIIREMNGAPMTILILLGLQSGPVEQLWMESVIGISDKPVARALGYLQMLHFVEHTEEGWLLARSGRAILQSLVPHRAEPAEIPASTRAPAAGTAPGTQGDPASKSEPDPGLQSGPDSGLQSGSSFGQPAAVPPGEAQLPEEESSSEWARRVPTLDLPASLTRNISDSCFINESINKKLNSIDRQKQKQRPPPAEFWRSEHFRPQKSGPDGPPAGEARPAKPPGELDAIWAELRRAGIRRNARTKALAAQPHLSPGYVRAHREAMQELGQSGPEWAGLLITLLEEGEPAPAREEPITCPCCHQYPCACEGEGW